MSLPDYYSILQVLPTATSAEIKAAYRRLAKIFHPDKNSGSPAAEEKFKQIKDAYENLINPLRRKKYDDRRNHSLSPKNAAAEFHKKATRKNYNFTEEEAKRRKYYQQHYKTTSYTPPKENKKAEGGLSNELKYILVSVPIAVALLLLIIRLYEKPKEEVKPSLHVGSDIHTATSPFENVLGKNAFDFSSKKVIKVVNNSGHDAIVFLRNDSLKNVRHHFVENHYQLFMENIPPTNYFVYSWLGDGFNLQRSNLAGAKGNYDKSFYADKITADLKTGSDTFIVMLLGKNSALSDSVLLKEIFKKEH
ncbi:MAG: J domain-containing protein [Bacteroidia bacterium]